MIEVMQGSPAARAAHARLNTTARPWPDHQSIADRFRAQAAAAPSALAVGGADGTLDYRTLDRLSDALALRLAAMGVCPGDLVALVMARSCKMIVALLAILKAGGGYLPLDGGWPDARLALLVAQARTRHLIADDPAAMAARLPGVVAIPATAANAAGRLPRTRPDAVAYVNFTSGSTGVPKGVPIRHDSVLRLVHGPLYAPLTPESRVLHLAPLPFDAATFEIWGPLLNGGACILYPPEMLRLSRLRRAVDEGAVDTLFLTTALFNAVVDEDAALLSCVRTVLTGGEAHSPPHVARALEAMAGNRLVNVYGPTECTTFATFHPVTRADISRGTLPIGRPIQNTGLHILDGNRLAEPGEMGEIWLSGPGLTQGYLGRPDIDAAAFRRLLVDGAPLRLYRTGDLGLLDARGDVVFHGRADDQVKISGHRVELGEVQAALGRIPGINRAFVTTEMPAQGGPRIVAFVLPEAARDPGMTPAALRRVLAETLPGYMIPSRIEIRHSFPLGATGKVDRTALLKGDGPPAMANTVSASG